MTTLEAIYEQEYRRNSEGMGAIVWVVFALLFLVSFLAGIITGCRIGGGW